MTLMAYPAGALRWCNRSLKTNLLEIVWSTNNLRKQVDVHFSEPIIILGFF